MFRDVSTPTDVGTYVTENALAIFPLCLQQIDLIHAHPKLIHTANNILRCKYYAIFTMQISNNSTIDLIHVSKFGW